MTPVFLYLIFVLEEGASSAEEAMLTSVRSYGKLVHYSKVPVNMGIISYLFCYQKYFSLSPYNS